MAPRQLRQAPNSSNLYDILDLILDKGIVIDAYVRVSLVGIELLTIDARVVIASVDTFIRYSEAMDQLGANVNDRFEAKKLPDMVHDGVADHVVDRGKEKVKEAVGGDGASRTAMSSVGKGVRTAAKTAGTAALAFGAEKLAEKITKRRNGAPPEPEESPDDDDDVEAFDEEESREEEPRQAPERRRRRKRRV